MGVCYIVGAGECPELKITPKSDDTVIAADGGYKYIIDLDIEPDIIIGDFDSLGNVPDSRNVIKLNPVKDITDMHAAVEEGIKRGYTEFHIFGACGGRIDHTVANIQLVASLAERKMKAYIHDGETVITSLCNSSVVFTKEFKGYISLFSHSEKCTGVSIKGLKYTLENAVLTNTFPLGVSNEFIGYESEIIIGNGTAVLIYNSCL